jgi:acyl-CoA synthetase (AMP-forming)/AMP-acid ligase II
MVYPGAGIPLSTGSAWGTSITNNSANWNTAYGWGNWAHTTLTGYGITDATPLAHKTTEDAINGLVKVNGSGTYSAVTDNSTNWTSGYTYRVTSASGTAPLTLTLASNGITGSIAAATTSAAGSMSSADKTKLDGIATGATNYTHPTGDGNLHVPATSTTNNGKVLTAGATAGSMSWASAGGYTLPAATTSALGGVQISGTDGGFTMSGNFLLQDDYILTTRAPLTTDWISFWKVADGAQGKMQISTLLALAGGSMTYPGAGIALSTGSAWGTSITNNSANWNTAYGWGNWAHTTLTGYGITDATPLAHKTTEDAINGLVKVNGSGTYSAVTDNSTNWAAGYTYRVTSASGTAPLTLTLASNGLTGSVAAATTSVAGSMSAADKTKLDGIATGATNYTHPIGDGNLHVPANGTSNSGKILTAGATGGSYTWETPTFSSLWTSVTGGIYRVSGCVSIGTISANFAHALHVTSDNPSSSTSYFSNTSSGTAVEILNTGTGIGVIGCAAANYGGQFCGYGVNLASGSLAVSGTARINSDGSFSPPTLTDAAAANNTIYYSSTQTKLVYKDSGGTIHALY